MSKFIKKSPRKNIRRDVSQNSTVLIAYPLILLASVSKPVCLCLAAFTWLLPKR